jgi:hypothetical protein
MKNSIPFLFAVVFCAAAATGCISRHETIHRDVERIKVQFENETAGRIFYEKLSRMPDMNHQESNVSFGIPLVLDYERKVVSDNNDKFNRAIRECDVNGDGMITVVEAKIFSGRP